LEAGNNGQRQMIRIYQLIGLSRSVSGDMDGSRSAYMRMLALDPNIEVDRNQPPHLRAPLQEARGYWANRIERFAVELRASRAQGAVRITLTDPMRMASNIVLFSRSAGTIAFDESRLAPRSSQLAPVEEIGEGGAAEYYAVITDAYGNTLISHGNEDEPHRIGELPSVGEGTAAPVEAGVPLFRSPVFWSITGGLLLAGGITAGVIIANTDFGVLRSTLSVQAQ
jgi:hypothetical protein